MKPSIYSLLFALLASFCLAACDVSEVTSVEPSPQQKEHFERNVRRAVQRAVQVPGIDNGSTLVVTQRGDTLIGPADSAMMAAPLRTVYVEIESPAYPKVVSGRALKAGTMVGVILLICLTILTVFIMVFVIIIRRQNGRNKIIAQAIEAGYELPESYYTGQGKAPTVNVTQLFDERRISPSPEKRADADGCADQPPLLDEAPKMADGIREAVRTANSVVLPERIKQLRQAFILIGIGIVLFISFAAANSPEVGFFCGGVLVVIGGAKLLTDYLTRKH